ncbi:MAG: DUF2694 domain-containing protein [Mycobacterium sp.]|nr:DUF2694 domain-containing protein [Mycobacterium sp.]
MSDAEPEFDAAHPSGHLLFRSCRGGYLHSVVLSEAVSDVRQPADVQALAEAVLRAADVSHLKAVMEVRREIIEAGFSPSPELPTPADLIRAEKHLNEHRLNQPES